ncbi:MAG: hypothetical protein ABFS38_02600 [Bacteroidota bacterium]
MNQFRKKTIVKELLIFIRTFLIVLLFFSACTNEKHTHRITLSVNSPLPTGNVPMDPEINFGKKVTSHNAIEMKSWPEYTISVPEMVKKKKRPESIKQGIVIHLPGDRPDRLVAITGLHSGDHWSGDLVAEYSLDGAVTWQPATIYPGTTVKQWRSTNHNKWNKAVHEGDIPAENNAILWNYFFDLSLPVKAVELRLRNSSDNQIASQKRFDLKPVSDLVILNHQNIHSICASGALPDSWSLTTSDNPTSGRPSIHCAVTEDIRQQPEQLTLQPKLKGWYRIYIGMERYGTCKFWLSGVNARYEIPNYLNNSKTGQDYQLFNEKEYYICSADMTDQDICISPGGARKWHDLRMQYIRLVAMTPKEVSHFKQIRQMAHTKGRPFAGYLEPCTPGASAPESLSLQEHLRNEMKLNQLRGSTDVYVHSIRIGSKAWYHSDVVERFMEWGPTWPQWMRQGDPMAEAVREARKAGLKIFADAGMNSTYYKSGGEYHVLTERFTNEHPGYLCADYPLCFDYRNPQVQAYVCSIIRELLMKYDVDGVNLDFGRWGYRKAYDAAALVAVLEQVDRDRKAAAKKWGHPVVISARIDYDEPPADGTPEPLFLAALRSWAKAGLVDRIMVNVYDKISPSLNLSHYLRAIEGTQTQFWGDLYQGTWYQPGSPAEDFRIALAWAEQGIDGGFFYYQRCRPTEWEHINWRMRLVDFPELQVGPY